MFCFSLVSAVPPFTQVQNFPNGYIIEFPNFDYLNNGQDYNLHVHIFNSTNGYFLTNTSSSCYFHLYNSSGSHLLKAEMSFEPPVDFSYNIGGGNFSENGFYSFIIYCNDSVNGGYIQKTIQITSYGDEPTMAEAISYGFFMLVCLAIFITSLIWFNSLTWGHYTNSEGTVVQVSQDRIKKIVLFFVCYISLLSLFFFAEVVAKTVIVTNNAYPVINAIFLILLVGLAPITLAVIVMSILTTITDSKLQQGILRGF